MSSAEVFVLGQKYTIKGDVSEEMITELSEMIDTKIKEVYAKNPSVPLEKALMLTIFNLAGEMHELKKDQDILVKHIKEKTDLLSTIFD
ncbi:cell division protein ZapA [Nitrospirota bacterium]